MPTYEYACTECGHAFEQFQSFNEDSLTVCPECNGRLRKVFSAAGVLFKGSGFYRTDSRASSSSGTGASSNGTSGNGSSSNGSSSNSSSGSSDSGSKSSSTSTATASS